MAVAEVAGPLPFDWRLSARRILRSPVTTIVMIAAGILCGLYYPRFAHAISPVAQVYLNFLKMVVLPYLVSSVIFSITAMVQDPKSVRYLGKVGIAVLVVSFLAVMVSGTFSMILQPGQIDNPQSRIELGEFINSQGSVSTDLAFPFQPPPANGDANGEHSILLDLVPNNVFNALASGQTIQVLLFCLLFGLAMGKIPQPSSMSLSQALNAVYRACTVLTNWFAWGLPFATFILIADQTASTGTRPLTLMGGYLLVMGLSCLTFLAVAFAIIAIRSRRSYWTTIKTLQPLLMVAITTRSTVASLPWVINLLSERLRFSLVVVELLVPLQAALLRTGPALLYTSGTLFIAQLYGHPLGVPDLLLVGVVSALLALTTGGMGSLLILSQMSIVCGYLKLPFEAAFALFVAVDAAVDTLMTLSSVSTIAASTAMIAPSHREATQIAEIVSEVPEAEPVR
ncbi:cation:dicarboxylase symporter family transporter [Mesorhizobium sp. M1C.F.Ca.ET.193.01.1.1]|uniref:dicarboxylate/amino acid:cation symporter n=3 Tax=Mesorhizobium TaxID=68287 RepID=UPI000FD3758C|nr:MULTISPECIES: cation:dicarboxylase symporter family transporter [unclassified Mesorhizobium]TGS98244.1 cation:dicarboxylase symporter family transporter [bacterium M00.F.Ca.ET.177.01.1.1]TGQ52652.1 cation:dicarboxylase symporter family transporter [Mesorhizobium sp. M1C.F.Ca.ET.210.01.1.1]TGQ70025.1 cation:dicarboxylase symporter family transporter [Mesorhizobium sp. M1C.F.Ca.ET.212.01.1.1]TGR05520.1 cation:dicarboxylase symporter family transporter [Mesorhizobium sp. M1C.F.Ca.ET.204.01.1.1]